MDQSKTNILISVVVPCYNCADQIQKAIDSVRDQTYSCFELIVVNDGSTDCSAEVLDSAATQEPRMQIIHQRNRGIPAARNAGLAKAEGEYVAFLDADDFWEHRFLEVMLGHILEEDVDLVYCGWQNLGLLGGRGQPYIPPNYDPAHRIQTFLSGCPWPVHAALTRRKLVVDVGGFDERWSAAEDYDLWLKIAISHEISRVPEVLAFYCHHSGEQMSNDTPRIAECHWLVQKQFLANNPEIEATLNPELIRDLTDGELLRRGYISYWRRDLVAARKIFRLVMKTGYGTPKDWMYMLPSLVPLPLHRSLIRMLEN